MSVPRFFVRGGGWIVMLIVVALAGCNLSTTAPIPTPRSSLFTPTNTFPPGRTALPSLTPFDFSNPNPTPLPAASQVTGGGGTGTNCISPVGWVAYAIESGDTLNLLAEATDTTAQALTQANCITNPDTLIVGQIIYLPMEPVVG